jgi:hypothetical protein
LIAGRRSLDWPSSNVLERLRLAAGQPVGTKGPRAGIDGQLQRLGTWQKRTDGLSALGAWTARLTLQSTAEALLPPSAEIITGIRPANYRIPTKRQGARPLPLFVAVGLDLQGAMHRAYTRAVRRLMFVNNIRT